MRIAVSLLLTLTTLALPGLAEAKPKKVSNGCTVSQIQSQAASECIRQMEQDVMHSRPLIHALYCSSTGKILCCQYDGNTIVNHSCTVVGAQSRPGSTNAPGGVLSRD